MNNAAEQIVNHIPQIGDRHPRRDALSKATGREKFASDYHPPDLLWLAVRRAGVAHAHILDVDVSQAAAIAGVRAVLTHRDIKGKNRVGVPEFDQPVLCDRKVRHCGDAVALVLAESRSVAAQAAESIHVSYEALPAVFDPEAALQPGAPLIHEEAKHGNLLLGGTITTGSGAAAFAECRHIVEGTFRLPCQEHAYLETECGIAWTDEAGVLTIVASTQTPFRDRLEIANSLGLPPEKVRVRAPYLGGGFGGKDGISVQGLLALAAMHSGGRPVKIVNTREESFVSSTKRHTATAQCRIGCDPDGMLRALSLRIVFDTGAYACLGGAVLELAMEHAGGVYRFPNAHIEGACVYTNNPLAGAFRGFGVPQVNAALEQLIDELAAKTGHDRLEFRLKNALSSGGKTACGARFGCSVGIRDCLKQIRGHVLWRNRESWISQAGPHRRRGVGLAAAVHGMGYGPVVPDTATAKLELHPDGTFEISVGVSDMGQGNISTFVQIAAGALMQPTESFRLVLPDTSRANPCGSSSASRTTFTYANALTLACARLKDQILAEAAAILGPEPASLSLEPAAVLHRASGRTIALAELAARMEPAGRLVSETYTAPTSSEVLDVDQELRSWGLPHKVFSFAAHLAYVEVDELTGEATVCQYLCATDAGKVLNPTVYEQQVHGGVVQGVGYALYEDFHFENGVVKTPNFATYILPTADDVPDISSIPVVVEEPEGPFGMKGLGEIVIDPVYPAVANAVRQAVGARIMDGPLTPEKILQALAEANA